MPIGLDASFCAPSGLATRTQWHTCGREGDTRKRDFWKRVGDESGRRSPRNAHVRRINESEKCQVCSVQRKRTLTLTSRKQTSDEQSRAEADVAHQLGALEQSSGREGEGEKEKARQSAHLILEQAEAGGQLVCGRRRPAHHQQRVALVERAHRVAHLLRRRQSCERTGTGTPVLLLYWNERVNADAPLSSEHSPIVKVNKQYSNRTEAQLLEGRLSAGAAEVTHATRAGCG